MKLNYAELSTILAALRYWQRTRLAQKTKMWDGGAGTAWKAEQDIATDGGTLTPLSVDQIDSLCERLNMEGLAE